MMRLQEVRDKQLEQLEKNPEGMFGGALEANINKKLKENAKEMAKLNVEYRLANDDFTGAQQAVQDRLKDIQDQKAYDLQVFQTMQNYLQNDLTESEKLQMAHNLQMNQLDYEAQLKKEADEYAYRLETGDFMSAVPGAGQVATSTGTYDLQGKTSAYGPYAEDPLYANKISALMEKNANTITPEQMDGVIKSIAPNSKLTGKAIHNVANKYGIDPLLLFSQIQLESRFGAEGAGTKNINFGGVKYVGQQNATRGTLSPDGDGSYYANFNTVEDAIDSQARELAKRKVTGGGTIGDADLFKNALFNAQMTMPENVRKGNMKQLNKFLQEGNEDAARNLIVRAAFGAQGGTEQADAVKRQVAINALIKVKSDLKAYVEEFGDTNILKGTMQEIQQKLRTAGNPKAAAISNEITNALVQYRSSVTGAAWGEQETAEYNKIFPDFKNTDKLNTAIIDTLAGSMQNFQDTALSIYAGMDTTSPEYQRVFKRDIPQINVPQVQVAPEKQSVFDEITGGGQQKGGLFMNRKRPEGEGGGVVWDFLKALGLKK